jgi:hypothetical protein
MKSEIPPAAQFVIGLGLTFAVVPALAFWGHVFVALLAAL